MWKHILAYSVLACGVGVLAFYGQQVTRGKWLVDKTDRCPDYEKYPIDVDMRLRWLNITHGAISVDFTLLDDVTEEGYGIYIEACKKTEFGCNIVFVIEDESACRFLVKYAEENFMDVLRRIGADEHCPIPKRSYSMVDYVFDSEEMPDEGMCGEFIGTVKLKKEEEDLACFAIHVHFDEDDDVKLI